MMAEDNWATMRNLQVGDNKRSSIRPAMRWLRDNLSINAHASGSPMRSVGTEGVQQRNWGFNGSGKLNIPLGEEEALRLSAGGYAYGGKILLPQGMQDQGAPGKINYGGANLSNLGVGYTNGGFNADASFNPSTLEKVLKLRYNLKF